MGEVSEKILTGGLAEAESVIAIDLPAWAVSGVHREKLTFRWADSRVETQDFLWTVDPLVSAEPSALVIKKSSSKREIRTIRLRSFDRPFRILSVTGVEFASPIILPGNSSNNHVLKFELNPSILPSDVRSVILIETDYGEIGRVEVGLLVLPASKEKPWWTRPDGDLGLRSSSY
jgi:hypothetical protein